MAGWVIWKSPLFSNRNPDCYAYDPSDPYQEKCASDSVPPIFRIEIDKALVDYSSVVTAVATGFIALFTWTLFKATGGLVGIAKEQREADERAREIEAGRVERSLKIAADTASAAKTAADAARDSAGSAQRQVYALDRQARALQMALHSDLPSIYIYGLNEIIEREDERGDYYEIMYKVANVGRASAIITEIREAIEEKLPEGWPIPDVVPEWHQLRRSPVIQPNEVVEVWMQFPSQSFPVRGNLRADSGGQEFDYFTPTGTNAGAFVSIGYAGAAGSLGFFRAGCVFDHEHNLWVPDRT